MQLMGNKRDEQTTALLSDSYLTTTLTSFRTVFLLSWAATCADLVEKLFLFWWWSTVSCYPTLQSCIGNTSATSWRPLLQQQVASRLELLNVVWLCTDCSLALHSCRILTLPTQTSLTYQNMLGLSWVLLTETWLQCQLLSCLSSIMSETFTTVGSRQKTRCTPFSVCFHSFKSALFFGCPAFTHSSGKNTRCSFCLVWACSSHQWQETLIWSHAPK